MLEYVGVLRKLATKNKVAGDRGSLTTMEHLIAINVFLEVQQVIRFYGLLPKPHNDLENRSPQLHIVAQYVAGGKKKSQQDKKKYDKVMDLVMSRGSTTIKRSLPRKITASGDNSVSLLVTVFMMLTSIVRERIEAKKDRTSVFKDCEYIGNKAGAKTDTDGNVVTTTFSNLFFARTGSLEEEGKKYFIERIGEVAVTDVSSGTTDVCLNLSIIAHCVLKTTKAFNKKNEKNFTRRCKTAQTRMSEGMLFLCEVTASGTKSRGGSGRASGGKMSVKTDTFRTIVANLCRQATPNQHSLLLDLANLGETSFGTVQEFIESCDTDEMDCDTPSKPELTKALIEEELGNYKNNQLKLVNVTKDSFMKGFRLRKMPENNNNTKFEEVKDSIVIVNTKAVNTIWSILKKRKSKGKINPWVTKVATTLEKYQALGWVTSLHSFQATNPPPPDTEFLVLLPDEISNSYFDKDDVGIGKGSGSEDDSDSSDDESSAKMGNGKKRGNDGDARGDAKRTR